MTDKELNACAANAIGLVMPAWGHCNDYGVTIDSCRDGPIYWSPLNDDGDAFRLAVKLGIDIKFDPEALVVVAFALLDEFAKPLLLPEIYEYGDEIAATRRAIVRAAAEIGKDKA